MKLNSIPKSGLWNGISDRLNENFSKINVEVESLGEATIKNCGYFSTLEALEHAYPIAGAGSKAYVGASYPYAIYLWNTASSAWVDSGSTGGEENVKLEDYYTKESVDEKVTELESEQKEQSYQTNSRLVELDGVRLPVFELGGVYISDNSLIPTINAKRIRMVQGTTLHLNVGDTLSVDSGYRFYIFYIKDGKLVDGVSWKIGTFSITIEADYFIQISADPETLVTNVTELAEKLHISNYTDAITPIVKALDKDMVYVQGKISGEISSDFAFGGVRLTDGKLDPFESTSQVHIIKPILLKKGDSIIASDLCEVYLFKNVNGVWQDMYTWKKGTFAITEDAEYNIILRYISQATITDISDIVSQLKISISNNLTEVVDKVYSLLYGQIEGYSGEVTRIAAPTNNLDYPIMFLADEVDLIVDGSKSFTGIEYKTKRFAIGATLAVTGKRNISSTSWLIRVEFLDSSDQRIGEELYTSGNILKRVIPDGTSTIKVTWAASWGKALEDKSVVTFSDLKIYYSDVEDFNIYDAKSSDAIKGITYGDFYPRSGRINNIITSDNSNEYPVIKKIDSIDFISGAAGNYMGLHLMLKKFVVGSTLAVTGKRSLTFNNWFIRIDCYDSSNQRIGGEVTTKENALKRIIPEGTDHIEITYAANWGSSLAANTKVVFSDLKVYYSDIEDLQKDTIGIGNSLYTGEKIVIGNEDESHRCNINIWKEYSADNVISGLDTEKVFHKNQSMTIFKDYVFYFSENGGGAVANYNTKEILGEFDYDPTIEQHSNSAQFSTMYYDASDEFPLLFISRCGNAAFQSGKHDYDEVLIYRVQRDGAIFSFTLINSIYLNATTYGLSWGIDNVRKRLYAVAPILGNWQVKEGNEVGFWVLPMPSKEQIISGDAIRLNESDAIAYFKTDYFIAQGCVVNNGVLYLGVSDNPTQSIWVYDCLKGKQLAKVPIMQGMEIEGVAVYNGNLYTSHKSQTALRIYELQF